MSDNNIGVEKKIRKMLEIQEGLNSVVTTEWRDQEFPWHEAIWTEATELFEHLPWKWWKSSTKPIDWPQVIMEAVDIWHFILSYSMESRDTDTLVSELTDIFAEFRINPKERRTEDIKEATKELVVSVLYDGIFIDYYEVCGSFTYLLDSLNVSFNDLYKLYIGKVQLNKLRWANDYGKSYVKMWGDQEDNQFLSELLNTLDVDADDFSEQVYTALETKYKEVLDAKGTS